MIKTFIVFTFLEFYQKRLSALKVHQAMHELYVVLWVFVMNRLAARVTLPGNAKTMQKCYFSYFLCSRNRQALVLYRHAPSSWFLGIRHHRFFWSAQFS